MAGTELEQAQEAGSSLEEARGDRRMVTAALMLAMAVTALEQLVVSTAMPSIIAELHGLDVYSWVTSAYLLTQTVTTPIYGKLADLWGRKRVLLFGLTLFALGSMLSGMATSMPGLIAMRAVQGLGAGAVGPIVLTMIADLFSLEERAKVQGLFSGIWGVSSVAGPALGGLLTDQLSWRWVFYVSVPFAALSAWILARHVDEEREHREVLPIDWSGAALLTAGSTALLVAVMQGNEQSTARGLVLLASAGGLFGLLIRCERRAADPILPLDLLTNVPIAAAIAGSFLIGGLLFAIDTFLPLYIQGVEGGTATAAGRTITPLFLAWAISVTIAAKVVVRLGFRTTALIGSVSIAAGVLGLALGTVWPSASGRMFLAGLILIGTGMGPTSLSFILGVQSAVSWGRRGAATGAVLFSRTMGGAMGVGILGATLIMALGRRLVAAHASGIDVAAALRPETHRLLSSHELHVVQEALGRSLRDVFLQMFALSLLVILLSALLQPGPADAAVPSDDDREYTPDLLS